MQDYLLVQGPPGTGKTSVIAEIVKRLCQGGQRVMLAAFTNQAVDNMLKRLDAEGFHDYVRLGHERGVDAHIQERLLQKLVETQEPSVRKILGTAAVVASTAATWCSLAQDPSAAGVRARSRGSARSPCQICPCTYQPIPWARDAAHGRHQGRST